MNICTPIKRWVEGATKRYIESLPDEKIIQLGNKILSANELTDQTFRKLIESVKGDVEVRIYFKGGDMATISNRTDSKNRGPGW